MQVDRKTERTMEVDVVLGEVPVKKEEELDLDRWRWFKG